MNKKLILAGVILLTICISVTMVSADDSDEVTINLENGKDLDIDGVKFTIPDGYQEDESGAYVAADDEGKLKGNKLCVDTFNKGEDLIKISVSDNKEPLTLDDIASFYTNAEKKKIGDHEGFFLQGDGKAVFGYIQDGRLVDILAPDENTISSMLK